MVKTTDSQLPEASVAHGRRRVVITTVSPEVGGGCYPVKRILNDRLTVYTDMIADGGDRLSGVLCFRHESEIEWRESPLEASSMDRWRASFELSKLGLWHYTVEGWIDRFATWQQHVRKKVDAGQNVTLDLLVGAQLISEAAGRASGDDADALGRIAGTLSSEQLTIAERTAAGLEQGSLVRLMGQYPDRSKSTSYDRVLIVVVDPGKARFSSWYEVFPRSCDGPGQHASFRDAAERLPYVASMGFDVLYLPPIHPIGKTHRKGRNNTLEAGPGDPGSPWAIGAEDGGHKAIHAELGTLEDFRLFVDKAKEHRIDVALDLAFQASPDHPYVKEHPEWFRRRPDGTIQYAENPPKKYEDIYPFDFESSEWRSLWQELLGIVLFWIEQGVRVFRVDNPHTKSLYFWEWCIREVKRRHPEVIFLAEAFTRPAVMYELAKRGFSQSYTYFTWRQTKDELTSYLTELTNTEVVEYFRPNFWPNTPDILPEHLQFNGRAAFISRLILAGTLSSNYGIYGPAFELMEHVARPGTEEYVDNEKFELKSWAIDRDDSLSHVVSCINRIRKDNPALQSNGSLRFHPTDNEQVLCYSKCDETHNNIVVVVVNLHPHYRHAAWITLDIEALGLTAGQTYQMHDLISEVRYLWTGSRNYVELDPSAFPAHIFCLRRRLRTEHDFDYYL